MYGMLFFFFQADEYRGKGTTGLPYFKCGCNNAVWLSMDMVVYPPPTASQHVPHGNTSNRRKSTGTKPTFVPSRSTEKHGGQHKPSDDSTGKYSSGQNTTTATSKYSHQGGIVSKAWNFIVGSAEIARKDQQQYPTSKLYKEGDRVVICSMKTGQPIRAIVRWTGQVQFSKESEMPSAMFAGLETVSYMSVWHM